MRIRNESEFTGEPGIAARFFFLIGLGFLLLGQVLLSLGNEFVYSQRPIDFAHWFILIGAVLLIPQVASFPRSVFSAIGIPLTLAGIACVIGMCVLDFIWWSFPDEQAREEFTKHISGVPSIWNVFAAIGPSSKVFNLGLFILSMNYISTRKAGVLLVAFASLILWHVIPLPSRLVIGYTLTLIGFSVMLINPPKVGSGQPG